MPRRMKKRKVVTLCGRAVSVSARVKMTTELKKSTRGIVCYHSVRCACEPHLLLFRMTGKCRIWRTDFDVDREITI